MDGALVKSKYGILVKFACMIFLAEFVRGAYMNFMPLYCRNVLGFHGLDISGTVFFAYFIAETFSKILVGWLLDRYNNRIILVLGLIVSFIAFISLKFIKLPVLLIIDGGLIGLGYAPVWLIVLGRISSFEEEKRVSSMSMIYSSWLAGLGLGMTSISIIISIGYSYALNVIIAAWFMCTIFGFFIKEGIQHSNTAKKQKLSSVWADIRNAKLLVPGMTLQTFSITLLIPIIAVYFTESFGLNTTQFGFMQAALGITVVICLGLLTRYTQKIAIKNLFLSGLLGTSIAIFFIGQVHNVILIVLFGVIAGISYAAVLPSWFTIMSNNISKTNMGVMWGVFSTLEGIGRAAGPLFGGFLGQYVNLQFSFTASSIIIIVLAVFYFVLGKKNKISFSEA